MPPWLSRLPSRLPAEDLSVYQQAALAERERKAAWKRWLQQGGGAPGPRRPQGGLGVFGRPRRDAGDR